ncbi:cell division protein [Peribacillus asahii]|uniref:Cell division protein n=1 Tax=Peribacillus asahii TaxID=228899 RepID=A0A3Q9RQ19_9BACI|nr:cell division protein FtsA [Peribacillus asahii]AZV44745.1 cell division protein [Peribacillus asahii]
MTETLFALDIGTRSVVGIILEKLSESYKIIDILSQEHAERAMLDGQIHDVMAVAKIIQQIKEQLEEKHGPLKKVSVAAAGRALKTEKATIAVNIKGKPMLSREDILHLEFSAVQEAQHLVAQKNQTNSTYYGVGYSVLYYRLDGQEIGSLIDQTGEEASVEIIATFLPKVVIESLLAALKRADLEMQALTLEPIAAINVLIPPSMRRLNVALVDIGAGTSDIALTDSGTVIAYGMVPIAGDEITEAISDYLLLDFPLAEEAKRKLMTNDVITVTDILGFEVDISKEEIIHNIQPALNRLADSISQEILELNNGKAPKAVMLVGGGSQTPELTKLIAKRLALPENRVAIRGIEAIQHVQFSSHVHKGPELVTPIGIAIAANKSPIQYMSILVNGQPIRLFDMEQTNVSDCLLTAGIKLNKLYGKPGMAKIVHFNGQQITIPGEHGTPPKILLNGVEVALDAAVKNEDIIEVTKGEDGHTAILCIHDLIDHMPSKKVTINGVTYIIEATITRNGSIVTRTEFIKDHDVITCSIPETIEELLQVLQLHELLRLIQPFQIELNEKIHKAPSIKGYIYKNNIEVKERASFEDGDIIQVLPPKSLTLAELAEALNIQLTYSIPITFNGNKVILTKALAEFCRGETRLSLSDTIQVGESLSYVPYKLEPFIFQDLFRHVNIDMPQHASSRFILIKNNQEATFHETLAPGDQLKILWPTMIQ